MGLFSKNKKQKLYTLEGAYVQDERKILNINFTYLSTSEKKAIDEVSQKINVSAKKVISRSQMGEDRQRDFEIQAAIRIGDKTLRIEKFRLRAIDKRTAKTVFDKTVSIKIKSAKEHK